MSAFPGIGHLIAVGAALAVIPLALYARKRRRTAYEQYCLIRGFTYEAERPDYARAYADVVELFRKDGRSDHVITGRLAGGPFRAFEYSYRVGKHRRVFGVMHWEVDNGTLPRFSLTPEGFWQRIGQRFGAQDIDFSEDPGFSRTYQLQGSDDGAIRALFTPDVRYFVGHERGHHVAGAGKQLFWWRRGALPGAQDLDGFVAAGDGIRRVLAKG